VYNELQMHRGLSCQDKLGAHSLSCAKIWASSIGNICGNVETFKKEMMCFPTREEALVLHAY